MIRAIATRRGRTGRSNALSPKCIALLAYATAVFPAAAHAQTRAVPAPAQADYVRAVYVDNLLSLPTTQQMGFRRYTAISAVIGGMRYPRSLLTEAINNVQPTTRYSALTIALNGQYERFQATLGRDDAEQVSGPAYCYFEVWGDGQRLFRSDAIRSSMTDVVVEGSFPKRSTPQEIDIPVQGVQSLRLLTRYAYEFTQSARYINRAYGCVWGNARLLARGAGDTVADPALRSALRTAALRLLNGVPTAKARTAREPAAAALRLGITPLRISAKPGSPLQAGATEDSIRSYVGELLCGIQGGASSAPRARLIPLAPAAAAALASALPAKSAVRGDGAASAVIGRSVGADLLVFGAVEPVSARWTITLSLLDIRNGRTLQHVEVPVELLPENTVGN